MSHASRFPTAPLSAFLLLLVCGLVVPHGVRGQASDALARADDAVARWVEQEKVAGAVLYVAEDGRPLLEKSYGWAQLYAYGAGQYASGDRVTGEGIERLARPRPMSPETVFDLASLAELPLAGVAGAELRHSDLGFMVLGRIVERVGGHRLDRVVGDRVYAPLGLRSTGFLPREGPFAATSHGNPFERRMVHDPDFGYRYTDIGPLQREVVRALTEGGPC